MKGNGYLVVSRTKVVTFRKTKPSLKGGEVAIRLNVTVDDRFFNQVAPVIDIAIGDEFLMTPKVHVHPEGVEVGAHLLDGIIEDTMDAAPDIDWSHVHCQTCDMEEDIGPGQGFRSGWPKCGRCGTTMTLGRRKKPLCSICDKWEQCKEAKTGPAFSCSSFRVMDLPDCKGCREEFGASSNCTHCPYRNHPLATPKEVPTDA